MRKFLTVLFLAILMIAPMPAAQASDPPFTVYIHTSKTSIGLGSSVRIYGSVAPNAHGKTVHIQRHYVGTSWVTIASPTLSSTSTYSRTIHPTKAGPTYYRVVKPASTSHSRDVSDTKRVDVYRWRSMYDMVVNDTVPTVFGLTTLGTFDIHGNSFARSFSVEDGGDVSWDIHTLRCTKFQTLVGIDAAGPVGTSGNADEEFFLDSLTTATIGQLGMLITEDPRFVQHDLGVFHNKVEFTASMDGTADTHKRVVFANSRLYCNS